MDGFKFENASQKVSRFDWYKSRAAKVALKGLCC